MTIGDRIKKLRKAEKLTQKEFAIRACISQSYLSGLENGTEIPADKLLKLIELEFNVSAEWLNNGTGEMYSHNTDNDRGYLSTLSNQGLLGIMMALNTKSNAQYNYVAGIIATIGRMLRKEAVLPDNISMPYLESIEQLLKSIDKLNEVLISKHINDPETTKKYLEDINLSLTAMIDSLTKIKF